MTEQVKQAAPPPLGYEFQLRNDHYAVVIAAPVNRLQRFLQLLVGISWRPVQ